MGRGRLRVYLGAAPGVGKTFAMLGEGHRRVERGTDAVVGFVETHGRRHTADLVGGLESFSDRSRYLNFAGFQEEGDEMMRSTFGRSLSRRVPAP